LYELIFRTNEVLIRTNEIIFFSFNASYGPPYILVLMLSFFIFYRTLALADFAAASNQMSTRDLTSDRKWHF